MANTSERPRECPACHGTFVASFEVWATPRFWVRLDAAGAWTATAQGPSKDETPLLGSYQCDSCGATARLLASRTPPR
jgi:hypothetical protein